MTIAYKTKMTNSKRTSRSSV